MVVIVPLVAILPIRVKNYFNSKIYEYFTGKRLVCNNRGQLSFKFLLRGGLVNKLENNDFETIKQLYSIFDVLKSRKPPLIIEA